VFNTGNGEKVLKRLITFSRLIGANIPDKQFLRILITFPGLRDTILAWWQSRPDPETKLPAVVDIVKNGAIIDDATLMSVAVSLVAARLPNTSQTDAALTEIVNCLDSSKPWGFSARLWILSKYDTAVELMNLFQSKVWLWVTEEHLSRLAAGVFPRMAGTALKEKFLSILRVSGNAATQTVVQFHDDLQSGTVGYSSIRKFVTSRNTSLPNQISHSKFLMLLSLLHNKHLAPIATTHLKTVHARALSDPYYGPLIP
jgi:hypothetical protein